jgi:hypothetical protein
MTRERRPKKATAGALRLGDGFSLPREAVSQTFGILAVRGAGKTYTAAVIVEELVGAGLPVVVVDPVGVWWGLRSSADWTAPGLPIIILGGDHGDVPLEVAAGALVAEFVVESRQSVVLDLSRFRKGETVRFMTDFAETLYRQSRAPLHLVIDEADALAPQRPQRGEERLLGAFEDLVRRGRARGLGVTLVTQRAAVLNKNVLTQIEVLICLRTIAPQDRDAIDDWIKVHGTPAERETMMASLASLERGTAWFWSPGWLHVFERVRIRRRRTFDSSATPSAQGGAATAPPALAPVDLDALRARMAETVDRLEAEDPRTLKKKIADLERQLAEVRANAEAKPAAHLAPMHEISLTRLVEALEEMGTKIDSLGKQAEFLRTQDWVVDLFKALGRVAGGRTRTAGASAPRPRASATTLPAEPPPARAPRSRAPPRAEPGSPLAGVKAGARTMLMRLAQFEPRGGLTRDQLATLAGLTVSGGSFGDYLGHLRRSGLIFDDAGRFRATPLGLAHAPSGLPVLDDTDLRAVWSSRLKAGARRMLAAVLAAPSELSRQELATAAGMGLSGGSFGDYLSTLKRNGLVVEDGRTLRPGPAFDVLTSGSEEA